jgi:hypothetical protein
MRSWAAIVFLCILSNRLTAAEPAALYVATNGNDAWSGRLAEPNAGRTDGPFATLERARDKIREMKKAAPLPAGGVTVWVRGGVYELTRPLELTAEDSGTTETPIVYRATKGERPALIGGRAIAGFVPYKGWILKADVGAQGFKGIHFRTLIFNGRRQEMARYPNRNPNDVNGGDWAYVDGQRINMYADMPDDSGYREQNRKLDFWQRNIPRYKRMLRVKAGDVHNWSRPEDGEVSIFPRFNWGHFVLAIESFDPRERVLKVGPGSVFEIRPGDRYFVRGLLEELDSPGEWCLDRQTWTLYFWPPEPLEGKAVYAPVVQSVIAMNGCAHVTVQGFTIECCDGSAVVLKDCTRVLIAGNTIRNAGDFNGSGVLVQGGRENGVAGNDIYSVGSHGINLGGGDLVSLTPGGNYADNNYIHHVGLVGRGAHGVALSGALNRVSHNLIHDTPHQGIMMWGAKHTIEFNRLRHTCLETEDAGAIGGGAVDWLSWQGTVIRYNWLQDTVGFGYDSQAGRWRSPYFAYSLYPDWAASGTQIVGNVLVRAPVGCLFLHSGRDNLVENNILIDGAQTQIQCSGWTTATGFWSTRVEEWIKKYEAAVQHPAWRAVTTLTDPRKVPLPDTRVMTGNVFRRNILCYRAPGAALLKFREVPLDHNECDYNLVWHYGMPLSTGYLGLKAEHGPNLLANPGLEDGPVGQFPTGWGWMSKANDKTRAVVVEGQAHEGRRSLLVEPGAEEPGAKVVKEIYLTLGPAVPFQPGKAYRFAVWLKAEGAAAHVRLDAFSWKKDVHNWVTMTTVAVTHEWRQYEFLFRLPKEGDAAYKPTMDKLNVRFTFVPGPAGFWVDDVSLREAEMTDEWEAWQARGMDRHSIVADPLFVDAEKDDYRIRPESPAFKLGFKAIPVDKIGPYQDDRRASWPIVEAEGTREKLLMSERKQ